MAVGKTIKELIDIFEYKKPLIHVEKIERKTLTPPAAILTLLFFWDTERQVVATFHVADSGVVATVSPSEKKSYEVYSGSGSPKDIAVSVVNWLARHFCDRPPTTTRRI